MPPGEGMKIDSQEGLLAMGLEIEIRYQSEPERLPAATTSHLNCYTVTHTLTLRHSPIAACPDRSTLIILIILGLCNCCVFIQTRHQLVLLRNKIMQATHYFVLIARFQEIGFSGTRAITSLCELRLDCFGNCFVFFFCTGFDLVKLPPPSFFTLTM